MSAKIPFPRYLDAPQQILFWTVDQMVPFATMVVIGMLTHTLLICMAIGGGIAWAFARYKDSNPDGFIMHYLYWIGVMPMKGRAAINPFSTRIFPI